MVPFASALPVWIAHVRPYARAVADTLQQAATTMSQPFVLGPGSPVRHVPPFDWSDWGIHWSTVYGIIVLTAIYTYWMAVTRRRQGLQQKNDGWRIAAFVSAQTVLFFALNGPLHDLSDDYLFSAHMVQHLLLVELWAPLLLLSLPDWAQGRLLGWGAPGRWLEWLARPVPAFTIFSVMFAIWHVQLLYGLMMRNHDVHIATHIAFMATAVLLWWPLVQCAPGRPRMSDPAKMLYLFLITVPMMPVAAFISLATDVLYPWYSVAPRVFGLSPLQDQQLGGLIMWVPGSLVFYVAITLIFFRWALAQEKREHPRDSEGVLRSGDRLDPVRPTPGRVP